MARILDIDPTRALKRLFHWNEAEESFHIETLQDITDLAELNKAKLNQTPEGWKGDMHQVASIPMPLYMELDRLGITRDEKAFRRWLDDPANAVFRTKHGKLSK